jgi:hypothetical protein
MKLSNKGPGARGLPGAAGWTSNASDYGQNPWIPNSGICAATVHHDSRKITYVGLPDMLAGETATCYKPGSRESQISRKALETIPVGGRSIFSFSRESQISRKALETLQSDVGIHAYPWS